MSAQLQRVLAAARALSPREKLQLLQLIAHDLGETGPFVEANASFWSTRPLEEIIQAQSALVVTDVRALAVDFWPEDESADDFNQFLAERRHEDLQRGS